MIDTRSWISADFLFEGVLGAVIGLAELNIAGNHRQQDGENYSAQEQQAVTL